jgi:hypothetical protein
MNNSSRRALCERPMRKTSKEVHPVEKENFLQGITHMKFFIDMGNIAGNY